MSKCLNSLVDLNGRIALVSGGAGHIGSSISVSLAQQGARVIIVDHPLADPARVARNLAGDTLAIEGWEMNLEDETQLKEINGLVGNNIGALDIFVHAAGLGGTSPLAGWGVPFEQQSLESFERAMRVNLSSAFVLAQSLHQYLAVSGKGSIVLVSSIYGSLGPDMSLYAGTNMQNPVGYGASKGGVLQLMKYLATLLAPRVRVNALSPGGVMRGQPDAFIERYAKRTPLGRMACEADLVGPALFLASDQSEYVTGHDLKVDGGWSVW